MSSVRRRHAAFLLFGLAMMIVPRVIVDAAPPMPDVKEATLDNGLRVLVLEDHRSPVVSVQLWYRVGSRNERPGATGLAHFLEHMMFKGTTTYGKGEFARLVEQNGGQDNACSTRRRSIPSGRSSWRSDGHVRRMTRTDSLPKG